MTRLFKYNTFLLLACLILLPACAWVAVNRTPAIQTASPLPASGINEKPTTIQPSMVPIVTKERTDPNVTVFPTVSITPALPSQNDFGLKARQYMQSLSEDIGPRPAGTPAETRAALYIKDAFIRMGYTPELQTFSIPTHRNGNQTNGSSANIIAVKPGLSKKEIIVGAHYDSAKAGHGADDNASGVGIMLEAAERIIALDIPYTIRFIAFGAEEIGLNGSTYYVEQMSSADLANTIAMINLDSLAAGNQAYVYGDAGPKSFLRDWILQDAQSDGFDLQTEPGNNLNNADGTPCDCSDYSPFEAAGLPYAYFEATDWKLGDKDGWTQVDPRFGVEGEIWHTKFDQIAYLDQTFPERIDQHLTLFVTLLVDALTRFEVIQ
jgi:alkaline phosphatase isozyme conversion protein